MAACCSTDELPFYDSARDKHESRGEWAAVDHISTSHRRSPRMRPRGGGIGAQAKVLGGGMFDDEQALPFVICACSSSNRAIPWQLGDRERQAPALLRVGHDLFRRRSRGRRGRRLRELMLMRAAGGRSGFEQQALTSVGRRAPGRAVRLDASNSMRAPAREHIYRSRTNRLNWPASWSASANAGGSRSRAPSRHAPGTLYAQHLSDNERAARAYDRVLRVDASHAEAKDFQFYGNDSARRISCCYSAGSRSRTRTIPSAWATYSESRSCALAQAGKPQDPALVRAHPQGRADDEGMLDLYREYYGSLQERRSLINIFKVRSVRCRTVTADQKKLASEIARLAEGRRPTLEKAIERYKTTFVDPDSSEARRFARERPVQADPATMR